VSDDLRELYQQVILDHQRRPRNFGPLDGADHAADGYNPLCGDRIRVELRTDDDGRVTRAGFSGSGCAICTASASLMTEGVRGCSAEDARRLFEGFTDLVTGRLEPGQADALLGKLVVFSGVKEFPVRVKCATLPWHTLRAALEGERQPVTTE
jgi:nitrogen fixation NifU-like protein